MVPIILAGGGGYRLWPLSQPSLPKQYLDPLSSGQTLLQHTLSRAASVVERPSLVVCPSSQRFLVAQQLRESHPSARILLEPSMQGTACAAGLAAMEVADTDPEMVCVLMPSDHHFVAGADFRQSLDRARDYALRGELAVMGVPARSPNTQFGYIRGAGKQTDPPIASFHEKPDPAQAQAYCQSGSYCWNTGIVVARADVLLSELGRLQPELYRSLGELWQARCEDTDFIRFDDGPVQEGAPISLDRAVLERTRLGRLVEWQGSDWTDLGSWESLFAEVPRDQRANATLRGRVVYRGASGNNVYSDAHRPVTLLGVDGLLVADTAEGLLIMDKQLSETPAFQKLVAELKSLSAGGDPDRDSNQ